MRLVAAAALALGLGAQGDRVLFADPRGEFAIRNYRVGAADWDPASGRIRFQASGAPLSVEMRRQGATLAAPTIEGEAAATGGAYSLTSANATGGARFVLEETAKGERRRSELSSGRLNYRAAGEEASFGVPGAFVLTQTRTGVGFEETTRVEGRSASVAFRMGGGDAGSRLRSATVVGPVTLRQVRVERTPGAPPTTQTTTASAERLTLDFTKPEGTITARGAVRLETSGPTTGVLEADEIVVTTDASRRWRRIRATGSPATATATSPDGKK